MPVYPGRRAGTHRVVVSLGATQQREWIVEGTKRDAQRLERQEQAKVSEKLARRAPTFSDFSIETYEPYAKAQFGANTWKRTRRYVVMRLVEHFGAIKLDAFQPLQVERFKQARLRDGMLPSSINAELRTFKAMLRWAKKHMRLPVATLEIKMLPEDRGRRVKAWSRDEVDRFLRVVNDRSPSLLPIVRFLLNTGCRKGEAIAAEWSWVDAPAAMLRIPVNRYWKPKNKCPREVPIDGILPMLLALPRTHDHIFISLLREPYAEFPERPFKGCVLEAGLTGSPHTTRHTFASHFLASVPDMRLLADVLGHSHTRVTEIYAHMLPGHLERARNVVNL